MPNILSVPDALAVPFILAISAAVLATISIRHERWLARRVSRSAGEEFADALELHHALHRIHLAERQLA